MANIDIPLVDGIVVTLTEEFLDDMVDAHGDDAAREITKIVEEKVKRMYNERDLQE